jgi:hypothetical protein
MASLMLPVLALAGRDHGEGDEWQNNANQYGNTKDRDRDGDRDKEVVRSGFPRETEYSC